MSTSSKPFFTFLAGAFTATAASVFLKSESGKKIRRNLAQSLRKFKNKAGHPVDSEWIA